jgi:hypothetical protein
MQRILACVKMKRDPWNHRSESEGEVAVEDEAEDEAIEPGLHDSSSCSLHSSSKRGLLR